MNPGLLGLRLSLVPAQAWFGWKSCKQEGRKASPHQDTGPSSSLLAEQAGRSLHSSYV